MKSKGRDRSGVARRQDTQNQKLVVSMQPVAAPDAEERLRRAIDLLLQAAARNTSQPEENQASRLA